MNVVGEDEKIQRNKQEKNEPNGHQEYLYSLEFAGIAVAGTIVGIPVIVTVILVIIVHTIVVSTGKSKDDRADGPNFVPQGSSNVSHRVSARESILG